MKFPINTYQVKGNIRGKCQLNVITSLICFLFFFKWRIPFSHVLRLFRDSFIFGEATYSHFFRVTTLTQQLISRSSYFFRTAPFLRSFFRTVISLQQLFFRNSYFFRVKLQVISHLFRIDISLGKLLFRATTF